jgi:beta-mannosidase
MFDENSRIDDILATERGRLILERYIPGITRDPNLTMLNGMALKFRKEWRFRTPVEHEIATIVRELNRPLRETVPAVRKRHSLDEVEAGEFKAGPSPLETPAERVRLSVVSGPRTLTPEPRTLLSGTWQMACEGAEKARLSGVWSDAIPAQVPGSVHAALVAAGRLPDPTFGRNQQIAQKESYKTWWLKRTFPRPASPGPHTLVFHGVCNKCAVWLNGRQLGGHEGMFGGPSFDVTELLRDTNTLIVRLDAIPIEGTPADNQSWRKTVVFNNVYGWHYAQLPSLGIWRSVEVRSEPAIDFHDPFVVTRDAHKGIVDLVVDMTSALPAWNGILEGTIAPDNFKGKSFGFRKRVRGGRGSQRLHLRFTIPDPQLWWPVDHGAQNLYRMRLSFGDAPVGAEFCFGIRTVRMDPLPDGPSPDKYNWTFVINGKPIFVKGNGWCTLDPLMDFSRARYDRFLSLARDQHIQMMRAWGSGMPETDDFYDLCDRYGIMIMQEWPAAWISHDEQPYDLMEETVRLNTLRIRNHPSLVMYTGGNEISRPYGKNVDMMGRYAVELDGTRAFHRGDPWGGSYHGYPSYWDRRHLDTCVNLDYPFLGEFGMASMPVHESVLRYLPKDEQTRWPPKADGAFMFHLPTFNRDSLDRITQYAAYFAPVDTCGVKRFVEATQVAQVVCLRHALERARTCWPDCSGALYYKMNDNYPAASWSTADWYGAPKIAHYLCQDAFSPLHACIVFDRVLLAGAAVNLPVFMLDDADVLKGKPWCVLVRAVDSRLKEIKREVFKGRGVVGSPRKVGHFSLTWQQTDTTPLFFVVDVLVHGRLADRTFYWLNFELAKGCLFNRPRTKLTLLAKGRRVTVANTGRVPALAVNIARPGHLDTFTVSDNYLWLDAGESRTVVVNDARGLTVSAWNG